MVVYFIQESESKRIKIGYTAKESGVKQRLRSHQTGNSEDLVVLHTIEGDESLEKHLHRRFNSLHCRGEWFELKEDLKDYMDSLESLKEIGMNDFLDKNSVKFMSFYRNVIFQYGFFHKDIFYGNKYFVNHKEIENEFKQSDFDILYFKHIVNNPVYTPVKVSLNIRTHPDFANYKTNAAYVFIYGSHIFARNNFELHKQQALKKLYGS